MTNSLAIAAQYNQRWVESYATDTRYYIPEKYQLGIITDYLRSQDIDFVTEKRIFSYPIDILCLRGSETIAIEMKSKNVGRGIEQARRDTSFVDYSYLAVWEHRISESLLDRITDLPIGLMSIDDEVTILDEPEKVGQQLCRTDSVIGLINGDVRDDNPVQESQSTDCR